MNMNGSTTVRKGSDIKLEGLAIKEGRPSDESRFAKTEMIERNSPMGMEIWNAFDSDSAMEVSWVEYSQVPVHVLNSLEESLETLLKIDHPNIIKYYDAWTDPKAKKVVFITEAMATGTGAMSNLKQLISRNVKMKLSVMKSWLTQVASGLNYLHTTYKEPVVLRDLRSTNIYLRSNTGTIKIGCVEKGYLMRFAHPSVLSGTPGYMPVETCSGRVSWSDDIYAFGMTALEMFSFKHPYYYSKTAFQIFYEQMSAVLPRTLSNIDDPLALDLICRCLSPQASRPTAAEILKHPFLQAEECCESAKDDPNLLNAAKLKDIIKKNPISKDHVALLSRDANSANSSSSSKDRSVTAASGSGSLSMTDCGNAPSVKCFDCRNPAEAVRDCVRIYFHHIQSLGELCRTIAKDFSVEDLGAVSFHYTDRAGDRVRFTKRTTLSELKVHAAEIQLGNKIRKK